MEMDLNNIIEKIKSEGVKEADKKSAEIISRAEEEAKKMIEEAEKKKEDIIKAAEKEALKLTNNGREAVKQASRDVMLGLREDIVSLFDKVVKKEVAEELKGDVLESMITCLVKNFKTEGEKEIEVLLNEKDKDTLGKTLLGKLKGEMKKGVTLKASSGVESGFRIGEKGKSSYYDFTDEAITEAFKTFLNPKMAEILESK